MPGGFAFDKLTRAATGDYQSDPLQPTISQAIRSEIFGVKIRNVDPRTAFLAKKKRFDRDVDEDKRELGRLRRSGASPEKMNEINDRIKRRIANFRSSVGKLADYCRDLRETGHLGGSPPALAHDDLVVAISGGTNYDRLKHASLPDRHRKF